jgi:thiamine biosynthesis lipoprotein
MRSDTLNSKDIEGGDSCLKWEYGRGYRQATRLRRRLLLGILLVAVVLIAGYAVKRSGSYGFTWAIRKSPLGFSGTQAKEDNKESSRSEFLMDTFVSIRAVGSNPEQAIQAAFDEIERIESLMSRHIPDSDASRINEGAGGEPVKVSGETLYVIEKALECASLTKGAFDITIGPLMDVWNFGLPDPAVPDADEIEQARSLIGWELLELDPANRTVRLPIQGMSIDLGGVAKGYAAQEGARILREYGVSHALIDAGGNIVTVGLRPDGEPWQIGIRDPRGESIEDTIGPTLSVANGAIATSGDYERFFIYDGRRYHHILNPETGMPVETVRSVTVMAEDALYADMLSTAVFVLGRDEGMRFIETLDGISAMIVTDDGDTIFSKGFPKMH